MADHDPTLQNAKRSSVQSVDRAVAILDCFTPQSPELGVSEIARQTGLTRSTVHRILQSLLAHELVFQEDGGSGYQLGTHILRLAHAASARINLLELARPVMTSLRDETDETVALHEYRGPHARTVVDQVESRQALRRTYTEVGEAIPIHQGAPGKVLLAFLPGEQLAEVLTGDLVPATEHTLTDPGALAQELERVRENGYAWSFQERVEGITSLAVPVKDHRGIVIAAISVSGPAGRYSRERLRHHTQLAVQATERLSELLGLNEAAPVQRAMASQPLPERESAPRNP